MEKIHEGKTEKLYKCDICSKFFSAKRHIRIHVLTVHEKRKEECSICDAKLSSKGKLTRHIKLVHEEINA